MAEIANEYLKKGSKVYVEGELRTREWEREGQKHYNTEVVANEMQMLDNRGDMPVSNTDVNPTSTTSNFSSPPPEDFDDDIPF